MFLLCIAAKVVCRRQHAACLIEQVAAMAAGILTLSDAVVRHLRMYYSAISTHELLVKS